MSELILETDGVVKEYGEVIRTRVLHGVTFGLGEGEFAALVGPSGSGKSTLLNMLGLLERPTAGCIRIDGVDTTKLDERQITRFRGQTLGFIFQFHHLLPAFTALENVLMPSYAAHLRPRREDIARAVETLEAVGLGDMLDRKSTQLSGGQQQRVAVARAIAQRPRLVLADEPTGNLDTHSADEVFALMRSFNQLYGTTFLIVTHDPRLAGRCDRTINLIDGRIVDVEGRGEKLRAI